MYYTSYPMRMQFVAGVVLIANSSAISVLITVLAGFYQTAVVLQALAMYFAAIVLGAVEDHPEVP